MSSLIVINLPKTITKSDLREIFARKGNVINVQLVFTVDKQYCYFALISYGNEDEALAALNYFDKSTVYSSCITVEQCHEMEDEKKDTTTVETMPHETNENTATLTQAEPYNKQLNRVDNEVICQNNSDILKNLDYVSKESSLPEKSANSAECSQNNYSHQFNGEKNLLISIKTRAKKNLKKTKTEKGQKQIPDGENIAQTTASLDSTVSSPILKVNIEKNVYPKIDFNNNYDHCKSIIRQYEQMDNQYNAFAIYSKNHVLFVKTLSRIAVKRTSNDRIQAGKMFAELLLNNFLSLSTIVDGLADFLRELRCSETNCTEYLSYSADIIAPLFISKTVIEFSNLRDVCDTLSPCETSFLFIEVVRKILNSDETLNTKNKTGGILEMYKMWIKSKMIPLEQFITDQHVNECFESDRLGVFLLSVAICDEMRRNHRDQLFIAMESWIYSTFDSNIIQFPQFIRALTIAIIMVCIDNPVDSLKNANHIKLLRCFIQLENLTETELKSRKVQCLYGIQIMHVVLDRPKGMLLKMFVKLYSGAVICKESFNLWKEDNQIINGFHEDLEIKVESIGELNSFFSIL